MPLVIKFLGFVILLDMDNTIVIVIHKTTKYSTKPFVTPITCDIVVLALLVNGYNCYLGH